MLTTSSAAGVWLIELDGGWVGRELMMAVRVVVVEEEVVILVLLMMVEVVVVVVVEDDDDDDADEVELSLKLFVSIQIILSLSSITQRHAAAGQHRPR